MRYLAKIVGLPKVDTGEMNVNVPTLTGKEVRVAYPLQTYLGLYQPYKLGDIVVVEIVEGRLYYGDRPYATGEHKMEVPKDSYSFVTPFGYIAFTPNNVTIQHIKGGKLVLSTQKFEPNNVIVDGKSSTEKFLQASTGSAISNPTKWR